MARITKLNITIEEANKIRKEMLAVCTEELHRPDLGPCFVIPKRFRDGAGYGRWKVGEDLYRAHRLMYVLVNGMILETDVTRHICNFSSCVRIDHLACGTHQENMADRDEAGRTLKGAAHGSSKLTEAEVRVIYKLATQYGTSGRKIARIFGIVHKQVQRILSAEKWNYLGLEPWKKKSTPHS